TIYFVIPNRFSGEESAFTSLSAASEVVPSLAQLPTDDRVRKVRQRASANNGSRIIVDERLSHIGAASFLCRFARGRKQGAAMLGIMRVGCQDVHSVALEQPLGRAPDWFTPIAGQSRGCHLNGASQLHPAQNSRQILLQNRISLRMRDHRSDAAIS